MQKVGFFREQANPLNAVRAGIGEQAGRNQIAEYLRNGALLVAAPGLEECLLGDALLEVHVLTDGHWVWPAELAHYVDCHGVLVPDPLLCRMRELGFRVPALDDARFEEIERELFDV